MFLKRGDALTEWQLIWIEFLDAVEASYSRTDDATDDEIRQAIKSDAPREGTDLFRLGVLVGKLQAIANFPCDAATAVDLLAKRAATLQNLRQAQLLSIREKVRVQAKIRWAVDPNCSQMMTGKMAEYLKRILTEEYPELSTVSARSIRDWIHEIAAHHRKNKPGRPRK